MSIGYRLSPLFSSLISPVRCKQRAGCPVGLHVLSDSLKQARLSWVRRRGAKASLKYQIPEPRVLPFPRLPWHNTQGCPPYRLSWAKNEKREKIALLLILNRIVLHLAIQPLSALSVSGRIQEQVSFVSCCPFTGALSITTSLWCYFSPGLLVFLSSLSCSSLTLCPLHVFFLLFHSPLDPFVPWWEKSPLFLFCQRKSLEVLTHTS